MTYRWSRQRLEQALRYDWMGFDDEARQALHDIADVIIDEKEPTENAPKAPTAPERQHSLAQGEERSSDSERPGESDDERYTEYLRRQFLRAHLFGDSEGE